MSRAARGCLFVAMLALVLPAQAAVASTAAVEITTSADPTESVAAQLGVTVSSPSTGGYVYLNVKPAGGTACAANPSADDGDHVIDAETGAGSSSRTANRTFNTAGTYVVCAWLQDYAVSGYPIVATATKLIDVRIPHLSLSIAAPPTVNAGDTFQVTTSAQAEVFRLVNVASVPDTGRGCPPNWEAAEATDGMATVLHDWEVTGGPFNQVANFRYDTPGTKLLCAYFLHVGYTNAEATASASVRVLPPCVVPTLSPGATLDAANAALTSAGCTPGRVTAEPSRRYARGTVLRAARKPGTQLAPQAAVGIVVSDGPPCVVPAIRRGATVTAAKRRLAAAGCTPGSIRHRANRQVRRGRVVGVLPAAGKKLAPRARVTLVVSAGRR